MKKFIILLDRNENKLFDKTDATNDDKQKYTPIRHKRSSSNIENNYNRENRYTKSYITMRSGVSNVNNIENENKGVFEKNLGNLKY